MHRCPALGVGPNMRQEANVENGGNADDHEDDDEKENGTEKAGEVLSKIHDRLQS